MAKGFHKPSSEPQERRDDDFREDNRQQQEPAAERPRPAKREEEPRQSRNDDFSPSDNFRDEPPAPSANIGRGYGKRHTEEENLERRQNERPARREFREERKPYNNDFQRDRPAPRNFDDRRDRPAPPRRDFDREERRGFRDDGPRNFDGPRRDNPRFDDRPARFEDDRRPRFDRNDDRAPRRDKEVDRFDDRRPSFNDRREDRFPPRDDRRDFDRPDRSESQGRFESRRDDHRDDRRFDGPRDSGRDDRRFSDRGGRDDRDRESYREDRRGSFDDNRRGGYRDESRSDFRPRDNRDFRQNDRYDDRRGGFDRRDDFRGRDDRGGFDRQSRGNFRDRNDRNDGPPSRSREWREMSRNNERQRPERPAAPQDDNNKRRFKPPVPPNLDDSTLKEPIRLNKFIARSTSYSRREADDLVKRGRVTVNDLPANPGTMIVPGDIVLLDEKPLTRRDHLVYILVNKPKDVELSTASIAGIANEGAPLNMGQLLKFDGAEQLSSIEPLAAEMLGLQLVSNDDRIEAHFKAHPPKATYTIVLAEPGPANLPAKLVPKEGEPNGELLLAEYADEERLRLSIVTRGGYPTDIIAAQKLNIEKIDRLHFAGLTKKDLPRGHWRFLNDREITWITKFQQ